MNAALANSALAPISNAKTILLTTYKREQARVAARALARRYRILQAILVPIAHRMLRYRTLHYELLPR